MLCLLPGGELLPWSVAEPHGTHHLTGVQVKEDAFTICGWFGLIFLLVRGTHTAQVVALTALLGMGSCMPLP